MVHANVRRLVLASLDSQTPECGICLEPFTHADATVMECCHVACKNCFKQLRKKECPFCRHKFAAQPRTPRETDHEFNLLIRRDDEVFTNLVTSLETSRQRLRNTQPRQTQRAINNVVTYFERMVTHLERERAYHRRRPRGVQPVSHIGRDPVYVPTDPTYSPATPRFSPDPPPAEWQERVTTPEAPQPPTRTAARVLFGDESEDEDEDIVTNTREDMVNLLGNDTDSESDSDVEVREVVQRAETAPTAPRRQRGPCRCTICGELGHQRNNRRFHPINTPTN